MPLFAAPLPFIGNYTFAQLKALTGMRDGAMAFVTNYPANKGSTWRYSAALTDWFPMAPTKVYENTGLITGIQQLADQLLVAIPCEAGLLTNKVWRLIASIGKDGTTDAFGATTVVRLGTAGTIGDTAIVTTGLSALLGAAQRSLGVDIWQRMASATSVERLGGSQQGSFGGAAGTSGALSSATTVSSVASQAVFVSITTTMGGTTNKPQLGYVALEIQP